ncbi:hypothetical protein GCM10022217_01450 [Chryseobacterium ginsenosidimutans]
MPPSPNASALAQYANQPVSNYTGVANISIPLYNIKSGEIELPISLSYHSSGIKISQEASSVGLGWAFNAGGVITRSVSGVDDLDPFNGYVTVSELPSTGGDDIVAGPGWQYFNAYQEINSGLRDGKPDILYYNFGGESGKMIFEKRQPNNNKVKGIPLQQTNAKFVYDLDTKEWEVTDGNGWKYYFAEREISRGYSGADDRNAPVYLVNDIQRGAQYDRLDPSISFNEYISAWYISKIVNPQDDSISFEYDGDAGHKSISQLNFYEQESYWGNPLNNSGKFWYGTLLEKKNSIAVSMTSSDNLNLKKIKFKNGYIDFHTSDREDLRPYNNFGTYSSKSQKLDSFEVFNLNGESIKKVDFGYSYFGDSYTGKNKENYWRLKLNAIQESFFDNVSGVYKKNPPYKLSYNSMEFPDKTSASTDHWGYYNGFDNDHLMLYDNVTQFLNGTSPDVEDYPNPPSYSNTYQSFVPFQLEYGPTPNGQTAAFLNGAFRESDPAYMQVGILNQINYPTGGATKFTYEPNKYSVGDQDIYNYDTSSFSVYADGDSVTDEVTSFYLSNYTRVKINCNIFNSGQQSALSSMKASIQNSGGIDIIRFSPSVNSFNRSIQAVLSPGMYYIKANTHAPTQSMTIHIMLNFLQRNLVDAVTGGGLRILKQENLDRDGSVKSRKTYNYTFKDTPWTSGRPMSNIQHIYRDGGDRIYYNEYGQNMAYRDVIVCSSENNAPISSSAQGNFVGYSEVSVSDIDQLGNNLGKSIYYYSNNPDVEWVNHLPGMPIITHMDNGNLIKEEHYNSNNVRLKLIESTYEKDESSTKMVKGVFTKNVLKDPPYGLGYGCFISLYRVYSEWWHPKQTIETNYDMNGNNPLVTTTNYSYENPLHKNLTKTTVTRSTGEIEIIRNKYPQDLSSGIDETSATIIAGMTTQNNINPVIQTEVTVDGKLVKGTINNFKVKNYTDQNNISRSMYLFNNIKTLKTGTTGDYDKRVDFVDYGKYGNITEAKKSDGTTSVYVWGYKEEYPVAKVDNSTLSAVEATLTATELAGIKGGTYDQIAMVSVLNKIRISLPNALVTTYTYSPLIGVTSITPPSGIIEYYKYDSQKRLERIVNIDGKILKEFKYNYAPIAASIFSNSYKDKTFIRNNCGASATGNPYLYMVPAGTYFSDLSQLEADQKALDDIDANGQNMANQNGTCTVQPSCSFVFSSGVSPQYSTNSTTTVNNTVNFNVVFPAYGLWQNWTNGINLGKIGSGCIPIANRQFTYLEAGVNRQWNIFIDTAGNCTVTLLSGTSADPTSYDPLNFTFQYQK